MGVMWLAFNDFFTKILLIATPDIANLRIAVLMGSIEGLPADRSFAPAYEVVVGLAEVATAEEAPMCREG